MNNILKHFWILMAFAAFIQPSTASCTGDSLNYLTPQDTVFLELNQFQEKIFTHVVEEKQTLYSLCKFYGIEMEEILSYNIDLINNALKPGFPVEIPVPNRAIKRYKGADFDETRHVPVFYIVKSGDNLYGVSKRMFKMPIDTMVRRNNLETITIKPGQKLFVGWMSTDGIPASYRKFKGSPEHKHNQLLRRKYVQAKSVKRERMEQGVAFWQKGVKGESDFYALHRTAPKGSIIAVSNPMNQKTVYAKVIAKLPEGVYGDDVVIVVSPKVASQLGALDARFFVKLKFLK